MIAPRPDLGRVLQHARDGFDRQLEALQALLRIPSVSTDPERREDVMRAARWVAERLEQIGMEDVSINETARHPIVTGEWLHAVGAPTVNVYCHYDVQPAEPLDAWRRPPFEPYLENERIYARGAADCKGHLSLHIAAAEAFLREGRLPINLRFLFEGEEEIGSPNLNTFLEDNRTELAADLAVVSDTQMYGEGIPSLSYGLRGMAYFEVRVSGPAHDLHSGSFGGAVVNPANALVQMLATLHDETGRVAVPGFYDRVRAIGEEERGRIQSLPFDETEFRVRAGVSELDGEAGFGTLERIWTRPTLDINGLWGGFSGEGSKTIIPAFAAAKLSCRLVPDQDYREIERLVAAHLERVRPLGVRLEIGLSWGSPPSVTPIDHPAVAAAARALEEAFGRPPLLQRAGGSIPVVASFAEILGIGSVLLGFGVPDGNGHGPNESFSLINYRGGLETIIRYWDELGLLGPEGARMAAPDRP